MFYYAAKLLWILAQPSNLLALLVVLAALALWFGRRRLVAPLLYGASAGLLVIGVLPVGQWLLGPLETRFPAPDELPDGIDGVIALGGGVDLPVAAARGDFALKDAAERLTALLVLGRRYRDARLVFTGGSGLLSGSTLSEAEVVRRFYQEQQFDTGRVLFEDRARDTYENALFSRELAQPARGERWLLVTSAAHMPRAVGVFRQAGWPVIPYPVDYRTTGRFELWAGLDVAQRLKEFDEAIKAWIGLVAYRLSGRTSALLPGP